VIELGYRKETDKSFDTIVENIERLTPEHQFRVLAVHNVQETLAEKGFERGPYKIIEICNAGFAHQALGKDVSVGMFMPCRYTVHIENDKTVVTLAKPTTIAEMLPESGLSDLAATVETTLKKIMEEAIA